MYVTFLVSFWLNVQVTSVSWKENELNMVDTPGHADFGGEVITFGIIVYL